MTSYTLNTGDDHKIEIHADVDLPANPWYLGYPDTNTIQNYIEMIAAH
ncbi:MAG: hypothetical protein ACOX8Q_03540 [Christensenellales bacterium]